MTQRFHVRDLLLAAFTGACMALTLATGASVAVAPQASVISASSIITLSPRTLAASPAWLGVVFGIAVACGMIVFVRLTAHSKEQGE